MGMKHTVTDLTTGEVKIEDIPDGVDPREWMRMRMDDCPLCQEARARGEIPYVASREELRRINGGAPRRQRWQRPRWRTLKRTVR